MKRQVGTAFPLRLRRKLADRKARADRYAALREMIVQDPTAIAVLAIVVGLLFWVSR